MSACRVEGSLLVGRPWRVARASGGRDREGRGGAGLACRFAPRPGMPLSWLASTRPPSRVRACVRRISASLGPMPGSSPCAARRWLVTARRARGVVGDGRGLRVRLRGGRAHQVVHQVRGGAGGLVDVDADLLGGRLRGGVPDALVVVVARVGDVALLVRRVLPRELGLRHQRAHALGQDVLRDEVVDGPVDRQRGEQAAGRGGPDHVARGLPDVLRLAQANLRARAPQANPQHTSSPGKSRRRRGRQFFVVCAGAPPRPPQSTWPFCRPNPQRRP